MLNLTITRSKGGSGERTVEVGDIQVPDLWHIGQALQSQTNRLVPMNYKEGDRYPIAEQGEMIIDTWHLCHDLLRHIQALLVLEREAPVAWDQCEQPIPYEPGPRFWENG